MKRWVDVPVMSREPWSVYDQMLAGRILLDNISGRKLQHVFFMSMNRPQRQVLVSEGESAQSEFTQDFVQGYF